jgi:hypothetical protein
MHRPARPFAQPSKQQPCRRRGRGARVQLNGLIPGGDDTFTCRAATDTALEEVEVAGRCSVAKLWRGGDVARRLVEGLCIRRSVRPRQRLLAYSGVQRPGTLAVRHLAHRTSFVVTGLSWAGKLSHSTAERRLPSADPPRCAEAELAMFAGFTQAYWSTPQHESHRRQGRRSSLTKINKE